MVNPMVLEHPLLTHKLTQARKKETDFSEFRRIIGEISGLMVYEVTRNLKLETLSIETPLASMEAKQLKEDQIAVVPILRAGLEMAEGIIRLVPSARVGHIGLFRDEETKKPVKYYEKLPENIDKMTVFLVDPMLATGNSTLLAIQLLKEHKVADIRLISLVAAPEGVKTIRTAYPELPIYLAALDEKLDKNGYILPGLGDAGDRMFGTK